MALIDKYSFSILTFNEDYRTQDDYFECDDLIAPAISLLNKKGYKTAFCCGGHPFYRIDLEVREEFPSEEDMESAEYKILFVDESKKLNKFDFDREKYPWCVLCQYNFFDSLYVVFLNKYEFPELPDGFYIDKDNGGIYYDSQRLPLSTESFEGITKIYEINKIFYEWVEKLESIS